MIFVETYELRELARRENFRKPQADAEPSQESCEPFSA
jgi:hypothetical protein